MKKVSAGFVHVESISYLCTLQRLCGNVVLPLPTAGVYVVNIGTRPPHRVVVVR
ncbi:MAG: hypothetical protein J5641_04550 [Bacteroidales bacterium]|nr:hypothetical protein [Bacteroidales bacterium]